MFLAVVVSDSIRMMCWFEAGHDVHRSYLKECVFQIPPPPKKRHVCNKQSRWTVFKNMDVWSKTKPLAGARNWERVRRTRESSLRRNCRKSQQIFHLAPTSLNHTECAVKADTCTLTNQKINHLKEKEKKTHQIHSLGALKTTVNVCKEAGFVGKSKRYKRGLITERTTTNQ